MFLKMLNFLLLGFIFGILASLMLEGYFGHDSSARTRALQVACGLLVLVGLPDFLRRRGAVPPPTEEPPQ